MLLLKLMASPSFRECMCKNKLFYEPVSTIIFYKQDSSTNVGVFKSDSTQQILLRKQLHTTAINKDMEAAFKAIGSGIAATGVIGPGIGVGIIFGNMLTATARNPSLTNKFFQFSVMGAALCESLGLFAIAIAFICMN